MPATSVYRATQRVLRARQRGVRFPTCFGQFAALIAIPSDPPPPPPFCVPAALQIRKQRQLEVAPESLLLEQPIGELGDFDVPLFLDRELLDGAGQTTVTVGVVKKR